MWMWLIVLVLGTQPARAQDPPPPAAREAYQDGLAAMENGRWADALAAFRRSYEIFPAAPALFNQGVVLRSLGRLREARDTFARLLDAHPDLSEEARAAANEMGAEVAERIAALEVVNLPRAGPDLRIRFDGEPYQDDGSRPLVVEVDPGEHALAVLAEGYEPFEWRERVGDGETRRVRVALEETGVPIWAWIAAGAGVVVGAVVVIALLATEQSQLTNVTMPEPGP